MKPLGMLTIVPPPGPPGVKSGRGTRFLFADGSELTHVARCVVTFGPEEVLQATIDVAIDPHDSIEAHPMLSYDAVRQAALHHGFNLSPLPPFLLDEQQRKAQAAALNPKGVE